MANEPKKQGKPKGKTPKTPKGVTTSAQSPYKDKNFKNLVKNKTLKGHKNKGHSEKVLVLDNPLDSTSAMSGKQKTTLILKDELPHTGTKEATLAVSSKSEKKEEKDKVVSLAQHEIKKTPEEHPLNYEALEPSKPKIVSTPTSSDKKRIQNEEDLGVQKDTAGFTGLEEVRGSPAQNRPSKWQLSAAGSDDSLLGCLEIICSIHSRPVSAAALTTGLPLEKGRLTPATFVRAAARGNFSARLVRKKLSDISKYTLPCILLLEGNKACLLISRDDETHAHEVVFPETGKGLVTLSMEDLSEIYSGVTIFVKPQYRYDQRSIDLDVDKPQAWFWGTLKKSWRIYTQVALAAILVNLFAIATPLFTMNVYDRVVPNTAVETLWFLAIGIFLVYIFDFLLKTLRVYFVDSAGKKADILLASRIFEHIMSMELSHRPMSSGGFANEVREFETLREFFSSATLVALIDLPFIFLFIGIIYIIGGPIAYVSLAAIPIVLGGAMAFHKPLTDWVKRTFREGAQKHALLVEAINGLETIKSFGAEGRMQRNWEGFVAQSADSSKALKFFGALALNFSAFVQQLFYILVIIVGVYLIAKGEMSMGGLIACSILSSRALAPLAQIVSLMTRFNQSMTALEALDKIIALPSERPAGKTFLHRPVLLGDIEYKGVDFSYPGAETKALDNFNLSIKAGEKIGILGRIGSGKSTLERLTLGLYTPQSGSITIDGTDIRQIDPTDLRKNIGYVPQDIYLFFGTVRDNITFGSQDIDDDTFGRAALISGVYDFVKLHPHGFDMPVGEGGSMLSGGQRQAIAMARALVRNPHIFICDEPTAMMDQASEARIVVRLQEYLKDKTFILITHRVPLLKTVDRLIIVDCGKVVADGPKEKIMEILAGSQVKATS